MYRDSGWLVGLGVCYVRSSDCVGLSLPLLLLLYAVTSMVCGVGVVMYVCKWD